MPIEAGAPVTYTSPYGGTLVISDAAETAPTITLRLTLWENTQYSLILLTPIYLAALQAAMPTIELKMGGVEIHSKTDKMIEAINANLYNGDLDFSSAI